MFRFFRGPDGTVPRLDGSLPVGASSDFEKERIQCAEEWDGVVRAICWSGYFPVPRQGCRKAAYT